MRKLTTLFIILMLGVTFFTIMGCEEDKAEPTVAEQLVGVWVANATTGDLGNTTASSGSLAGAGWTTYQLTINENGTYAVEGANPYDLVAYGGDGDGTIHYSGTYTIDDSQDPMWIDLTCTASDLELFFTSNATLQPMQPGIISLNADADELMIQYGSLAYSVPRPTAFMAAPGTLVKQ